MTERLNRFLARIDNAEVPIGSFLHSGDLHGARAASATDLDYVIVDMEHENFDFMTLANTLQWLISPRDMRRLGSPVATPTPLVRVPANAAEHGEWLVKQALDCGAFGIVVPRLEAAADADRIVRAARYSQGPDGVEPRGHRGVFPSNLASRYWACQGFDEYAERSRLWPLDPGGDLFLMFLIESAEGIASLEEIVAVQGVGALLFGAADLGVSLGSRNPEFPAFVRARQRFVDGCRAAGVLAGTVAVTVEQYEAAIAQGFDFVAGADMQRRASQPWPADRKRAARPAAPANAVGF